MRHVAVLLLVAACSNDAVTIAPASLWSDQDMIPRRQFHREAVDTVWEVGGEADTTFLNPRWLAAGAAGVTVWDDGRKAVVRVSRSGSVQWSFGREGAGPGEFRTVRDVAHLAGGGAAVVDAENRRLTIVNPNGELAVEASLGNASPLSVSARPGGGVVVLTDQPDEPFVSFDESGVAGGAVAFPWGGYGELPPIARQGKVQGVQGVREGGWVFGFTAGNGWWRFADRGPPAQGFPYAEHVDFPATVNTVRRSTGDDGVVTEVRESVPAAPGYAESAKSFGGRGDTLFVHFGGGSRYRWRVVDLFSVDSGTYRGSLRLPVVARQIAVGPDVIYALKEALYPTLVALRRRAEAS